MESNKHGRQGREESRKERRWAEEGPMETQERGVRLALAGTLQSHRNLRRLTWKVFFGGPKPPCFMATRWLGSVGNQVRTRKLRPRTLWLMHLETCQRAPPAGLPLTVPTALSHSSYVIWLLLGVLLQLPSGPWKGLRASFANTKRNSAKATKFMPRELL